METIGLMSEQPMCQNPLALQQLKRIWRECFEADDGYLDAYFSIGYRPEQTLVFQDDRHYPGNAHPSALPVPRHPSGKGSTVQGSLSVCGGYPAAGTGQTDRK